MKSQPKVELNERALLWVLAFIQFTNVLDFLIMMPLGPQYMRVFSINPAQFGFLVSLYATSAGIAGIAASIILDRFDRKKALLILYLGFSIGTFFCAIAPGYYVLALARTVAGAFGGVSGATILAIIGDVVPENRRGAAMGMVMSAFSIASIIGVPLGMYLANHLGWHAPFYLLTALSLMIWAASWRVLPSITGHLHESGERPSAWRRMALVIAEMNHLRSFAVMALMTAAGFTVFPYLSPYMVHNVGLTESELPAIYFCGGIFTVFSMNIIGRLSDRVGKFRMFAIMSSLSFIPVFILTHLSKVPLFAALSVTTALMVCMSGRFVPAMALITSSVDREHRGSFMSMNSSVQQFSSGLASFVSGFILGTAADGKLMYFEWIGFLSIFLAALSLIVGRWITPVVQPTEELLSPAICSLD